jgi:DNA-binding NarL/FixJ family response regulator
MPQEFGVFARSTEVLLVDDEPQLRKLLATLLSWDQSYHVMTASSGEEALDLSRNRSDRIDILITDVQKGPRNYRYSRPKVKRFSNWNHYFADRTGTRKANETRRLAARMLSLGCIRTRREVN